MRPLICMIRAAAKTLQGFSQQHAILKHKVLDSLPLAQLHVDIYIYIVSDVTYAIVVIV